MVDQIEESLSSAETAVQGMVDSFVTDLKLTSENLVLTTSECGREQIDTIEVLIHPAIYLKTVIYTGNYRSIRKGCTTLYRRTKKT